jgi:hypothetical protein
MSSVYSRNRITSKSCLDLLGGDTRFELLLRLAMGEEPEQMAARLGRVGLWDRQRELQVARLGMRTRLGVRAREGAQH